jgi:hypothetical protein
MKILFLHDFAHFNILIARFLGVSCTKIRSLIGANRRGAKGA